MRISGTEPSSVVLSETKLFQKDKKWRPKAPKEAKANIFKLRSIYKNTQNKTKLAK